MSTDHAWVQENLAAYLAGGLEPAERERLEQHTADCSPCAAALAEARALDTVLSDLFVEARPSAALEDRIIQTLRTQAAARRLSVPAWLALAAAAVLVGLTGMAANQVLVFGTTTSLGVARSSIENTSDNPAAQGKLADEEVAELAEAARARMLAQLDKQGEREEEQLRSQTEGIKKEIQETLQRQEEDRSNKGERDKDSALGGWGGASDGVENAATDRGIRPSNHFQPGKVLEQLKEEEKAKRFRNDSYSRNLDGRSQLADREVQKQRKSVPLSSAKGAAAADDTEAQKSSADSPPEQAGPRKIIIRTGELEYEVQSFDAAVATITRLVKNIKGAFISTVNSDKLANGKVRGTVVVRVPPENLDELIQQLRTDLGKSGELKNQRLGSLDITKQYTDLESELKAARAMEERLLQIIKTGKGEIKDLLAAEKELGNWRTRIEKIEGELRYYANQVALSTLTIRLYEKEITAPFAFIEREQVQMGIEVEDVDQALQEAQKAVREAKGRISRAELKQPSQGQFSALLDFEIAPDAAGPLRDRLKQLGTVARFDITRVEETQDGAPSAPPLSGRGEEGTKVKRADTRFHVHFYNLTDVPPHETVLISLACVDVESALKTLLTRVDKAAGRVLSSYLSSTRGPQTQGDLQFQVKTTLADALLEDIKSVGEVMTLQVRETTKVETTRKKRGFQVKLWALETATPRETEEIQLACVDVAASYRQVQEAVLKAKGRLRNAQLNEQDRRNITAVLDFEVRRADEEAVRAALLKAGAVYTRKVSRAAEADNVVDSKLRWQVTFLNQANIPPREVHKFGVEVADVDQTTAVLSALAGKHDGRTVEANISRERNGRVTGKLIYDVPMAEVHELLDAVKSAGTVRVQQVIKHPEVPESPLAVARLDITLSNTELIVPSDSGVGPSVRRGLADSLTVLLWSLRILILGLCVLLPWALVIWAIYQLVVRLRRRLLTRSA